LNPRLRRLEPRKQRGRSELRDVRSSGYESDEGVSSDVSRSVKPRGVARRVRSVLPQFSPESPQMTRLSEDGVLGERSFSRQTKPGRPRHMFANTEVMKRQSEITTTQPHGCEAGSRVDRPTRFATGQRTDSAFATAQVDSASRSVTTSSSYRISMDAHASRMLSSTSAYWEGSSHFSHVSRSGHCA
jgi:hypothetical protein